MSASVTQTIQQYLSQHSSTYIEQWRLWSTQLPSFTGFDQRVLAALFVPFQHAVTISALDEDQSCFFVEHYQEAAITLRLVLADAPVAQQIGMMLASFAALDAYAYMIGSLPINVQWVMSGAQGRELPAVVAFPTVHPVHLCIWDGSGWPDMEAYGTPCIAGGCKGQLGVELRVQTARAAHEDHTPYESLPPAYGTIVPDAAWRLLWALTSLKDAREEILIDGFYDTLVFGEDDEIALLHALPDSRHYMAERWGVEEVLMGLSGFQLQYAHLLTPACTVTSVLSGEQEKAEIPVNGSARVDFQLLPGQEPHDIFSMVRRHLDTQGFHDVEMHLLYARAPIKTPLHHPFVQWLQAATQLAYGKPPVVLPLVTSTRRYSVVQEGGTPTVVVSSDYTRLSGVQQEQQFIALATQTALLIAYVESIADAR
jgi:hypothetical protein